MALKVLDKEVLSVITALTLVGSIVYTANILRPKYIEPLVAIGLLNENCVIGEYPSIVVDGENTTFCLLLVNYNSTPALLRVDYKIVPQDMLPTNASPSPSRPLLSMYYALSPGQNITTKVNVPIKVNNTLLGKRVALVFELWIFDPEAHIWRYTGRWVHLYVNVLPRP